MGGPLIDLEWTWAVHSTSVSATPESDRRRCAACIVRPLTVCGVVALAEAPPMAALARNVHLDAGETLFHEDDPADEVFTVTQGMLKLSKLLPDGRRQITGFPVAGFYLGLAFADKYIYSATAVTPVRVCRFPRRAFLALLDRFPAVEKDLLGRAATELAAAQKQMLLLGRKTARERVASLLLQLARQQRARQGAMVELPMSRADIADYLGLTVETVSRSLSGLRKAGLIDLPDPHRFQLLQLRRLVAEGGEGDVLPELDPEG